MKITIIGGGNMGGSIAKGLAMGSLIPAGDITVTARSEETLAKVKGYDPQILTSLDNASAVVGADLVIVAVKPWLIENVLAEVKDHLDYWKQAVASVVAGVSFDKLRTLLDNGSGVEPVMYRIIPNTAISLLESVTFIASSGASAGKQDEVSAIFKEMGTVVRVSEDMMPAGTSLASCGIAFALKYIDASIQGGVKLGFSEDEARAVVMQTMKGALRLLQENSSMPQAEIDKVTTPGGITLKGLAAMQEAGFTEAVIAGLEKSR